VLILPAPPAPAVKPTPAEPREFKPPAPPTPPIATLIDPPALSIPAAVVPVSILAIPKLAKSNHPPAIQNVPLAPAKPALKLFVPPDFERDSAIYCQKRIGEWTEPDVYNLFGDPLRQRAAPGDGKKEDSGRILAFSDPTGRYREIELDFAPDTGLLRSVFVYPWQMTWNDCRRLWDGDVSSTQANKGRKFYSYLNRRLDVLVDPAGKVISFGLY
jgi:hypothetical protein